MRQSEDSQYIYTIDPEGDMRVPARLFTSKKLLEHVQEETLTQVKNAASLPGIVGSSIAMPDMHMGYGFCVGAVSAFDSKEGIVSPGAIGFDINCGVRLLSSNVDVSRVEDFVEELLELFAQRVPVGVGQQSSISLSQQQIRELLVKGSSWALENGYGNQEDVDCCEENGMFLGADAMKLSQRARARGMNQLGTLGAGNHFLELQVVEEVYDEELAESFGLSKKGSVCVMIHCGSRGLGHQVCTDYLRRIQQEAPEIMDSLAEKNLAYMPLGSSLANDYLAAMRAAANFAFANRHVIAHQVRSAFSRLIPESDLRTVYDVAHNIAKLETHVVDGVEREVLVHRKGATRAFPANHPSLSKKFSDTGHPVLIPGSMGTSSYVLVGTDKAMQLSFGSSAHGAGRLMSRTQARDDFSGSQVVSELKKQGIHVSASSVSGVADEAPGVYKDVDEVIRVTTDSGIAKKVVRLRPLGVLKG